MNSNPKEKKELKRNLKIYEVHWTVVKNQKEQFKLLIKRLNIDSCILILDFKENFKVTESGNQTINDYCNKRQIPCLGGALIFNDNGNIKNHYINFFPKFFHMTHYFHLKCWYLL